MHILFTGGGSGGHIFPNLALLRQLRTDPSVTCSYIGERGSMEEGLVLEEDIPFYRIHAGKLRRYVSIRNVLDIFKLGAGILEAVGVIKKVQPDVIFAKGGYVSLPVVIAGRLLKKPVIIHESDVIPGLTTKLCSRFATVICTSWEKTASFLPHARHKIVLTGIPIREELLHGKEERGRIFAGIEKNTLPTLWVSGGSQGASAINDFIKAYLSVLLEKYNIVHHVGKGKQFSIELPLKLRRRYTQLEFAGEELADLYAFADIIVNRAGSTGLAEFEALGKPVILIPLPLSQSRGDQIDNAEEYKKRHPKSTIVIPQKELEMGTFEKALKSLVRHSEKTKTSHMSLANGKILELLRKAGA